MADSAKSETRRWVIEIKDVSAGSGEEKKKGKSPLNTLQRIIANPGQLIRSSLLDSAEDLYESENKKIKSAGLALGVSIEAANKMLGQVENIANFSIDRYCNLQEDYSTKQFISNWQDTYSRTKSAASSLLSGVASMSNFGPWGMIAGGLMGAANFGFNQYMQYQKRMSSYYQNLNSTNYETGFAASRAGLIGSSGTEN